MAIFFNLCNFLKDFDVYISRTVKICMFGVKRMTDGKLLERLKRRDEGGLKILIGKYSAYVGTIVYNTIGQSAAYEDIEEVVSDIFMAIWEHAENITELKGYIGATSRNKALNKLKGIMLTDELKDNLAAGDETAEEVEKREVTRILYEAIEALGEPDCEIFFRYYYNEEKINDIAKELGVNISTVKSKLKRGKEKLSAYLSERRDLI